MVGFLNRVGCQLSETNQGPVNAGSVINTSFLTPAEAGAVDGQQYYWLIEEGNDFQEFIGTYTASGTSVSVDTVLKSKISGSAGTTKMTLAGGATLRSIAPAQGLEALRQVVRTTRTSNTILGVNDIAGLFEFTTGGFTQTFTAAATLGNGWNCILYNSSTGDVTLDPNGSETIDGLTSFVMYPGEARLIQCDGSGFHSVVLQGFTKKFTATGSNTFTKPPGYSVIEGELQAAGGGGGSGSRAGPGVANTGGGAGGGGQRLRFSAPAADVGATETVTVGAGGSIGASIGTSSANGNPGGAGGNTSFGSWATAIGGLAGPGGLTSGGGGSNGSPGSDGTNDGDGGGGGNGASSAPGAGGKGKGGGGGGGGGGTRNAGSQGGAGGLGGDGFAIVRGR